MARNGQRSKCRLELLRRGARVRWGLSPQGSDHHNHSDAASRHCVFCGAVLTGGCLSGLLCGACRQESFIRRVCHELGRELVARFQSPAEKGSMLLNLQILAENVQTRNNVEYVTVTGMETGPTPLLQMVDYGLREEEKPLKGKLVGKTISIQVESVRALFSGRPQLSGRLVQNGK